MQWSEAMDYCHDLGSESAMPSSQEEYEIHIKLYDRDLTRGWLGFHRYNDYSMFDWSYTKMSEINTIIENGTALWLNWCNDEPNNGDEGAPFVKEKCILFLG